VDYPQEVRNCTGHHLHCWPCCLHLLQPCCRFGYSDELLLLPEVLVPPLALLPASTAEFTQQGIDFLTQMFAKHDLDQDQALSPQELVSLFATCPLTPWGPEVYHQAPTNHRRWLGLPGYLCLWHLTALLEPTRCSALLAHLGFDYHAPALPAPPPPLAATKERRAEAAKSSPKAVYSCLVVGPRDAGKTTFCQRFLGRDHEATSLIPVDELPKATVNSVMVYGQTKFLVLLDTDITTAADCLTPLQTSSDVVCLVYDSSNPRSFEYCARIYLRYFSTTQLPVLVVANKSDKGVVRQDYILQPEAFCAKHKLPPPQRASARLVPAKDIFLKLATMAAFPRFQAAWMLFYRGR